MAIKDMLARQQRNTKTVGDGSKAQSYAQGAQTFWNSGIYDNTKEVTSENLADIQKINPNAKVGNVIRVGNAGFSGALGNFTNSTAGALLSSGIDAAGALMPRNTDTNEFQSGVKQGIYSGLSMVPGWGQAASMALKLVDNIGSATGLNLDALNKDQSRAAGINGWGRIFNNAIGAIPGASLIAGAIAGNTIDAYNTREVKGLSDAFGGTVNDINIAGTMGGKSYITNGAANTFIGNQNNNVDTLTSLAKWNSIRKNADAADYYNNYINRASGFSMASDLFRIGKSGMKLPSVDEIRSIIKHNDSQVIEAFQNGGVIGVDTNVLPEGALHKDLNHLEDVNPDVGEEVTTKGIPVVVTDSEGNVEQVAEIEKEEIILRKELTDRLEELWKDGSEEAMIWAGKLLALEIITNTQDNTGQLDDGKEIK